MNTCQDCVHHIPRFGPYLDKCDMVRDAVGNAKDCLLARMVVIGECGPRGRYFLAKPAHVPWYKRLFA